MQPIYRFPAINRPQQADLESPGHTVREERAAAPPPDDDLDYFLRRPQAAAVQPRAQARVWMLSTAIPTARSAQRESAAPASAATRPEDAPFMR